MNKNIETIFDLIKESALSYGNKYDVVWVKNFETEYKKNYVNLWNDIVVNAEQIKARNASENGSRNIGLIGKLDYDWLVAFFAIVITGNTVVLLDPVDLKIQDKIKGCSIDQVYGNSEMANSKVIYADDSEQMKVFDSNVSKDDSAVIIYTSGTTGEQKGVVLTHNNIMSNVKCGAYFVENSIKAGDTTIPFLPPTHMLEITVGILTPIYYGMTICFGRGMKYALKDLVVFKPSALVLVPMIVENIRDKISILMRRGLSDIAQFTGGNLRTIVCGGAQLRHDVIDEFELLGINILEGYGITECSPIISCNRKNEKKIKSVGKKAPDAYCQMKLIDGELCVKGDIVFKEYYNNPEETNKVKKDEWFHTGDLCKIDEEGYIYITGRMKNLIILSDGNNVCPEEIEAYFSGYDFIKTMFVKESDNKIVALVHPNDELEISSDEIKEKIMESVKTVNLKLPQYKRIRDVIISDDDFEKTALGKVRRFKYVG